ncbi:MAG: class I SAM-dependent methyltransferase [Desulfomonilaceae bacterium]
MDIVRLYHKIGERFRKRRMAKFSKLFKITSETRILDVGGTPFNWKFIESSPKIDLLNLNPSHVRAQDLSQNMSFIWGDGLDLKFQDDYYDIAFSNSTIEHVGTYENQKIFASEIKRIGKGFFLQTPAREFFVEPHYLALFIHWLPISIQRRLLRNFSIWGILERPDRRQIENNLSEIRLLNKKEFYKLFHDCNIMREKFLFFTKSYIAYRQPAQKLVH